MKTLSKAAGVYPLDFFGTSVLAAFSGREFPNKARKNFLRHLGVREQDLVLLHQVHGAQVQHVSLVQEAAGQEGDGLVTDVPGIALGVLTADCLPIFFVDLEKGAIGIAHAGWCGLKAGLLSKMIQSLRYLYGCQPKAIRAVIGPAIRKDAYEVGEEFREYFPRHYEARTAADGTRRGRVDLVGAALDQLRQEGLWDAHILDTGICTASDNSLFFSSRTEGTSERTLSLIQRTC